MNRASGPVLWVTHQSRTGALIALP